MVRSANQEYTVYIAVSISGWGNTGYQEFSTDKLQETVITIVPSSACKERMSQPELVDEDLIVCAGGDNEGGPCKVSNQTTIQCYPFLRVTVVGH